MPRFTREDVGDAVERYLGKFPGVAGATACVTGEADPGISTRVEIGTTASAEDVSVEDGTENSE